VGDVVRIGRGKTLWNVEEHFPREYPEVTVHLWTLRSQTTGRVLRTGERSDNIRVTLVWTLEEVVYGGEALTNA
jgi:hypothetical protein